MLCSKLISVCFQEKGVLQPPYARRAGMGSRKAADRKLLAVSDNIQKARLRVAERVVAP